MQYLINTVDNGHINWSIQSELLMDEAKHVWSLYKKGIIRNIWFSENKDALLMIESENREQVKTILDDFPLVKANLIEYKITLLLPYTGFERLLNGTEQCIPSFA
ncbi:MAG: hypothetical protein RBT80_13170 [Candidatus Vecturithrix sp.]|nr:hypothetical protein [Candidatus Vecturithrix sp.]